MSNTEKKPLLVAKNIKKDFKSKKNTVHAVSGIDLTIYKGETLALVGESGCGKSTLGRTLIRMLEATEGTIEYNGTDITTLERLAFKPFRQKMQMVFQDPYASLDPRMTVRDIIAEPIETYNMYNSKDEITAHVVRLMQEVGIPTEFLYRYPHQFSGGQRQRIGIARAIALRPELIVCDEPVSALDVSVQSQVLNLLKQLQKDHDLTYLFIGHDLSVINFIADRVCVMFLGRICEIADKDELYNNPAHPYTEFLLDAIPMADPHLRDKPRKIISGEIPSPVNPPSGCYFHTRCPYATEECRTRQPEMRDLGNGHMVACHRQ